MAAVGASPEKAGLRAFLERPAVLFAAVVTVAVVAFFGAGIATGRQLFFTHETAFGTLSPGSDLWHLNLPFKHFYASELRHGRLPFWCPLMGTGMPLFAEGEVGALQPLNLLLYGLLPLPLAINWSILIHLVLGGVFTALFAHELGAGRAGGALAGVVFALSGFLVPHAKHINIVETAAWVPLLFLLLERFRRAPRPATGIALAGTVAMLWLSGHPQIAYYALLAAALYAIVLAIAATDRARDALVFAGSALLAVVLGIALAAPQLLSTSLLNDLGPRSQPRTCAEATRFDYPPSYAITFVRPMAFGDPGVVKTVDGGGPNEHFVGFEVPDRLNLFWEITGYVGLLPLLLAPLGIARSLRSKRGAPLLAVLATSALLVLGRHGGLVKAYCLLPGFTSFRHHTRFLLFVDLALAVFAGLGASVLLERLARRGAAAATLLVSLCFVDLYAALGSHNPKVEASRWLQTPESARRIFEAEAGHGDPFRIAVLDLKMIAFANAYYRAGGWKGDLAPYDPAREFLYPNANLLHGLAALGHRAPLYPAWTFGDVPIGIAPRQLSTFNARYVLAPYPAALATFGGVDGKMPLLATFPGDELAGGKDRYELRLYRNPDALPRAFLVPRARVVGANALSAIASPSFDPRREVLLSLDPGEQLPPNAPNAGEEPIATPVDVRRYESQYVELRTHAATSAWLFLGDTYYPEWRATIDGEDVPIYRANQAGRAIAVPSGDHRVEFAYHATSFRRGVRIALFAFAILALWLALPMLREKAKS